MKKNNHKSKNSRMIFQLSAGPSSSESDQMKALNHFVADRTQEIKYPLKVILEHIQKTMERYGRRDFEYISYKDYHYLMKTMQDISHQVQHCYDVANKLLILNKKRQGLPSGTSDCNKILLEEIERFKEQFRLSDVKVKLRLRARLPPVCLGQMEWEEVIRNIAVNAFQAMPAGGELSIHSFLDLKAKMVCVEFKDTGMGIPKENLSHVFEPFFSTKLAENRKNAGLGLSIVHTLIKECHGTITLNSSLRRGTTVKIYLPILGKPS